MTSDIEHLVTASGIAAPIAFVAIYALLTVALVPGSAPSVAAGALFGAAWGSLLVLLGATLGASGAYLIARRLGRAPLRARAGARFAGIDEWVARRAFLTVLYVRLIPIFPFSAVNYAFGLTSVEPRPYITATALGILPGTVALVALGSSLRDPSSASFLLAAGAIAGLALIGSLVARPLRPPAPFTDDGPKRTATGSRAHSSELRSP